VIKLLDILKEAKQVGTLYHWTYFESLIKILKSNELKANIHGDYNSVDFRAKSNPSFEVKPHVSFTRSKGKVFGNDHIFSMPCALEIDGDKLSNNYKVFPYSMQDNPKIQAGQYVDPDDEEEETYQAEYEERVNGNIKNLDKYIKAIVIDKNPWELDFKLFKKEDIDYLIDYSENNNIPIKYIK
jgi:hypothetical protein